MSRGASPKREREYEELNERFAKRGRYGKRGPQVAARIVNKQRAQYGETKGEKREEKENKSLIAICRWTAIVTRRSQILSRVSSHSR